MHVNLFSKFAGQAGSRPAGETPSDAVARAVVVPGGSDGVKEGRLMSRYGNLTHSEEERINLKLSELSKRTGSHWSYHVMDRRGAEQMSPLLEIVIDGQICRPITLPVSANSPAQVICDCLDKQAEKRTLH